MAEEGCKSICSNEQEEKPIRTRSLPRPGGRRRPRSESLRRISERAERVGDAAQKQVTRRISFLAVSRRWKVESTKIDSPLPVPSDVHRDILVRGEASWEAVRELVQVVEGVWEGWRGSIASVNVQHF